jgi:serine protease Do
MATQAVSTAPAVFEPSISPLSELGQTHLSEALSTTIRSVGASVMSIEVDRAGIDSYFLGVVIRPDGLILAPASPLAGAMSVLVNLPGGVPYVGTVVGSDPTSGLAVVHINGVNNLHAIRLGSQVAVPGEVTFAITSAGGANIALGTVKSANVDPDVGGAALIDVLSTDIESSISPSGSVLVNAHGRFVGIVTGVVNGAVVATPSWLASRVASELAANGKVVHGWLGMLVGKNVQANAQRKSAGVLVENVAPDSTAGIAGLSQGDEIVSINGHPVTSLAALRGRLYVLAPNTRVGMGIWRNGLKKTLEVSLGADEPN